MDGICPFATDVIVDKVKANVAYAPGGGPKVGFCDHTAGGFYGTLANPGFWNEKGYSVHFGIARDGRICQIVNVNNRAWGQGRLGPSVTWPAYDQMGRRNPNEYLISIEHEDAETVNGQTRFIPGSQWTQAQYDADLRVKRWCKEQFEAKGFDVLRFGLNSLAGHHMFDGVSRAECPGRYWRNEYQSRLYSDLVGGDEVPEHYKGELNDRRWRETVTYWLMTGELRGRHTTDGKVELLNKNGQPFSPAVVLPLQVPSWGQAS